MYEHFKVIHVGDTDASGHVFFTKLQIIALEAFEEWLHNKGIPLDEIFKKEPFLMPIVHVEANYLALVSVGDRLKVCMIVYRMGTSSFTVASHIYNKEEVLVATVSVVHVVMDKVTSKSCPIPDKMRALLKTLMFESMQV